jgi:toxin HigB-1
MIIGFRHKGLKLLYQTGSAKGVQAAHKAKLVSILASLDVAAKPEELALPSYRLHPLKGDMKGHWSIWVNGNWRVTFRFDGTDVELVDYQDYH